MLLLIFEPQFKPVAGSLTSYKMLKACSDLWGISVITSGAGLAVGVDSIVTGITSSYFDSLTIILDHEV